ncbi:PALP-domain-containing protein [Tilletiopsis washingtonensis]|uniref:cysteine synthase n=1 Tax=Tilletiopsis washingtonensis TaxID=58919 RepID=A0A316ZD07_9BASI|nr:PALP-domain-containing protein [Tilletiopsis washingtonensis]PWN99421.1 PALP-domain-containing protein [Tilletiopsis washingtonensis]
MPRSLFLLGLLTGLTLSLASLSTALFAASVREKRRIARARAAQGLGGRRARRFTAGREDGEESGSESESGEEEKWEVIEVRKGEVVRGVQGAIGNTPLIRIASLSRLTGCDILGKAEFLNPGGSPKDRVALQILNDAERSGQLHPRTNSCVFEGSVGSTGISLAMLARAKGYRCSIVMPDDVAREKKEMLAALGAELRAVRPRAIADPAHFVNEARRLAQTFGGANGTLLAGPGAHGHQEEEEEEAEGEKSEGQAKPGAAVVVSSTATGGAEEGADALSEKPRGFFADQFESESNFRAHYRGTGPEIWRQTGGMIDAFVCGAGTGGTLAGVSRFLKRKSRGAVHVVLADPQGSGLFNKVKHGVVYSHTEAEGTRRRHQTDTVVEGIGLNRLTHNFAHALPATDDAERVLDQEAVAMSRWLVQEDGLFLGSSSAVNLVAAVRVAQKLKLAQQQSERRGGGEDKEAATTPPTVVTLLCDSGARHLSRFWNDEALAQLGLHATADMHWLFPDGGADV